MRKIEVIRVSAQQLGTTWAVCTASDGRTVVFLREYAEGQRPEGELTLIA